MRIGRRGALAGAADIPAPVFQTFESDNGTGTSFAVARPTGTADGDRLVTILYFESANAVTATLTPPSGHTLVASNSLASGPAKMYLYEREASSEPASWSWATSASVTAYIATVLMRPKGTSYGGRVQPQESSSNMIYTSGGAASGESFIVMGSAAIGISANGSLPSGMTAAVTTVASKLIVHRGTLNNGGSINDSVSWTDGDPPGLFNCSLLVRG